MQRLYWDYDFNTTFGNMTKRKGLISPETYKGLSITYGPDQQRVKTVYQDNSSTLLSKYFALGMYEKEVHVTNGTREFYYIHTPSGLSAILESKSSGDELHYIHTDILGSYDVITNASGTVEERLSFDPWGRRRSVATWDYNNVPTTFLFDRGFTGHEHLDDFGVINMNGRVYDPLLAMFLSPDNYVQSPENTQNLNRYAYCLNNPLIYTDPDGEWFFSVLFSLGGAWFGGASANNWEINPLDWDYSSFSTWTGLLNGGVSGFVIGANTDYSVNRWLTRKQRFAIQDMDLLEYNAKFSSTGTQDFPYFDRNGNLIPGDETLDAFSERYFSKFKYRKKAIRKHNDEIFTGKYADKLAVTDPKSINDMFTIHFHTKSFNSMKRLYYSMGHEYVHLSHLIEFPGMKLNVSEYAAYNWCASLYYSSGQSVIGDSFKRVALKEYYGDNTFSKLYGENSRLVL